MDFFDFIRDVSKDQELAQEFVNKVNDQNTTAASLHDYFNGKNRNKWIYDGVGPGACGKIIALRAICGTLTLERDVATGLVRPMY